MNRVLVVAYYFPPVSASGSVRPLAFCRYLEALGWTPEILATEPASIHPPLDTDCGLAAHVPPSVVVNRVAHLDPLQTLIGLRDRLVDRPAPRQVAPETTARAKGDTTSWLRNSTALLQEHLFAFPDHHVSWMRPAVRRAEQVARERPFDVVFATGKPWSGLLTGMTIARRLRLPLVADFRDPWTRNPYASWSSFGTYSRARRLEARICQQACFAIANTDELRAQFVRDYPQMGDKFITITNGYDDWSVARGSVSRRSAGPDGSRLELWHFGTLYGQRDPIELLSALCELHDEGVATPDTIRLRLVGRWLITNAESNRVAQILEARNLLVREPHLQHAQCLERMREATALLVLQPASPLQIPAKIYEYVAAGRPILVVGGEGATSNLVERHALGTCCADHRSELKRLLRALLAGETLRFAGTKERERLHYRELTGKLATCLNGALVRSGSTGPVPALAQS